MRLLRVGEAGKERPAVLIADDDLEEDGEALDVGDEVRDFDSVFFEEVGLAGLAKLVAEGRGRRISTETQRIGPPIARPGKLLCIGLNYADHAAESGLELPTEPVLFGKASNTVVGPTDDVLLPRGSQRSDWEIELGVVIGREARYLPDEAAAVSCIAGYTISNDVSERELQLERGGQWIKGKSCETFNPLGPWLVTADAVPNPLDLSMRLSVSGKVMQDSSTRHMSFSPAYVVWYLSHFMVLEPGDLINTGTPAGVGAGQHPPRYLREGDVMELEISGLGRQCSKVLPAP